MVQLAKISRNGRITVPAEIRRALHAEDGDTLVWEINANGRVSVHRLGMDTGYLAAVNGTLSEWNSAEDDEAYRDL
jgi:antitoxin PrlF